ncbi:transmembrane protein, putative [Bodo saltans]|uniref:Transmembrane protein, putative n=1 Tax=Bodo saltans TaxID=75058 RepID=A0A0S4INA8_BODSA|nr:transmembrane protein, putative [Bodo saltans]|eukprot:CUE75069.1 transmembrane protein, putative [Bodo saltans]
MVNRPAFVNNLSIRIPVAPTDDEIMEWFVAQEAQREYEESLRHQEQNASFLTRSWNAFASLSRDLETSVHHVAHWMMLWSQGHYLGQMLTAAAAAAGAAASMSQDEKDFNIPLSPSMKEFSTMVVGIVLVALGIIASGFVVATEFPALCAFLGLQHNGSEAKTVRRWCMLLSGSCSFMFATILGVNSFLFPMVPSAEHSDAAFFILFRATGILWGIVSGFLWFSLAHRELKAAEAKVERWSAFDVCALNDDNQIQLATTTGHCTAA